MAIKLPALLMIVAMVGCSKQSVSTSKTPDSSSPGKSAVADRVCIEKVACFTDAKFDSEFSDEGFVAKINSAIKSLSAEKLQKAGFVIEENSLAGNANWYLDIACTCIPKGLGYKLIARIRGYPRASSQHEAPCLFEVVLEEEIKRPTKASAKQAANEVAVKFLKFFLEKTSPRH